MKRMTRREAWSYYEGVLANSEVAEQGHLACIDTSSGEIVVGQVGTGLRPIGYFDESKTGNGTLTVRVQLFREIWVDRFANGTSTDAVAASDIGNLCYVLDSQTVSIDSDTDSRSVAGRIWGLQNGGVLVEVGSN